MSASEDPSMHLVRKMFALDKPLPLTANVFYGQPLILSDNYYYSSSLPFTIFSTLFHYKNRAFSLFIDTKFKHYLMFYRWNCNTLPLRRSRHHKRRSVFGPVLEKGTFVVLYRYQLFFAVPYELEMHGMQLHPLAKTLCKFDWILAKFGQI